MIMNQRFVLFRRAGVFYCEDRTTRKQTSLRTRDKQEALTLLHARNESVRQPVLKLQIARASGMALHAALREPAAWSIAPFTRTCRVSRRLLRDHFTFLILH
jgi:hypothetical protein